MDWKVEDSGRPDYLDGVQAQYMITENDSPVAYVFEKAGCNQNHHRPRVEENSLTNAEKLA